MSKSSVGDAPIVLTPSLQRYDWGDPTFIPELLGIAAGGGPLAEAWFGAHPLGPASAQVDGAAAPLDRLIADSPAQLLGASTFARFAGLPYLLKVLAAAKPLSIQVHPNEAQAAAGFAAEEQLGLPRDAPNRCYRDTNHKPELLVALTSFDALCGFRPPREVSSALESLPEISTLR